jgi:uncharacterized protein YecT (DUF1311 family)
VTRPESVPGRKWIKLAIPALFLVSINALAASEACETAGSIDDAIRCLQVEVSKAEAAMTQYLEASKKRHAANKLQSALLESSQIAWLDSRGTRCPIVNILPRDQKKHAAEVLYCRWRITRERTHQLWAGFLTYPDGRQPVLPEPMR